MNQGSVFFSLLGLVLGRAVVRPQSIESDDWFVLVNRWPEESAGVPVSGALDTEEKISVWFHCESPDLSVCSDLLFLTCLTVGDRASISALGFYCM